MTKVPLHISLGADVRQRASKDACRSREDGNPCSQASVLLETGRRMHAQVDSRLRAE
jgi:hypothetical protein